MTDMSSVQPFTLLNLSRSMTVLNLGYNGIKGNFPEEIFGFPNLRELYLFLNEGLKGYLPKSNWSSHLRVLDLSPSDIKGKIPESIGNLKFLEVLSLGGCNFTGSVPTSIGSLTRLTKFNLKYNHLIGELPSSISKFQKVTDINLSGNMLTGQIPDIFVNFSYGPQFPYHVNVLSHLTNFNLSRNFLDGRVPSWLFSLPSLDYIDLSINRLTGPIVQFNLPNSLRQLDLGNNEIKGPFPSSIFQLVNLNYLDISSNNLSGTVKFDMLSKLKNLEYLDLSNNCLLSFSSTRNYSMPNLISLVFSFCNISEFPMFLRTSEKLEWLYLSNNRIHGQILKSESEGWKSLSDLNLSSNFLTYIEEHPWKNIHTLDLQNNSIEGTILVPPPTTDVFLASKNKLSGQIPPSICRLSSLQYLSLSDNNLSRIIPPCFGNLISSLDMLHLQNNNLQGKIPDTFANTSWFRSLDLSGNNLEWPLPRSLANCRQLEVINVGNNKIRDKFPCWLGSLPELKILILRSNRFYGSICDSNAIVRFGNLRIIDLARNEFTGSLPTRIFASMEAMMNTENDESGAQYMQQSYYYHDSVNVTMKGRVYTLDRILTIFTAIDLSGNWFQGEIPVVLGELKSLLVLNLSHNSLTGNIPFSLANLKALESFDLSFNKLNGRIPEQLISITTLEVLNLSYNRFWGVIPRANQFKTFGNDSFTGTKVCVENHYRRNVATMGQRKNHLVHQFFQKKVKLQADLIGKSQ